MTLLTFTIPPVPELDLVSELSFRGGSLKTLAQLLPPTGCIKGDKFKWSQKAHNIFENLEKCFTEALELALPNFDQVFEVIMRGVAFFIEKLNTGKLKYSIYDKEFYAIVRAI